MWRLEFLLTCYLDLEKLVYGAKLRVTGGTKPTGFDLKHDVAIISLDTESTSEGDKLVGFTWAARYFDTATLKSVSPQDYDKRFEESRVYGTSFNSREHRPGSTAHIVALADMRRAVKELFEPLCRDYDYKSIARSDEKSYDHAQHKTCIPRKKVILLLPDKEKCLRDLKVLGCDFHKG
jgi:hypothetical protein